MAGRGGYVVVGEDQKGNLVELFRSDQYDGLESQRRVARAVAAGIRNCGLEARVLSATQIARINPSQITKPKKAS